MDQRIKKLGIPKSMFSYKTNNSKSKEKSPNDFWKDCENEKMENKQLSTMQDSNRDNSSMFSSLRSNNNSGRNLSQPAKNETKKNNRRLSTINDTKESNLNIEKMYSNLINNLSNDVMNFKNIKKEKIKERSNEKYHSEGSSVDSVLTFTEKKSKRINRSMETQQERVLNSSLMEIREDRLTSTLNNNERVKKITNHLYLDSLKKKEKFNMKVQEHEKMKKEKEIEDCTFKPKINNYKYVKKKSLNVDVYQRTKKWKETNVEKLEKTKQQNYNQKLNECSFKPNINNKTITATVESDTIKDKDTLRYLKRINEAKKTKEDKMAKLCPDYNLIYDKLFKKNKNQPLNLTSDCRLNTDYYTFNPFKNKNDFSNLKRKLKEELDSLVLTKEEEENE